ncbi:WD40 repeat-like protein [Suillus hirtellus]|nr:WD40 repeat-like protein [Suillus hirtellus]
MNCIMIDISGDSTLLASVSDGTTRIWSLETCSLVAGPFKSTNWVVNAVRFSQDSKKLALGSYGRLSGCLEVWDIRSQRLLLYREGYWGSGSVPVFWTTKDTAIVSAFSFEVGAEIKRIYEFDGSTLETIGAPFEGHTQAITSIALSLDCALLASAAWDHTIKLWAFESRQLLASFDNYSVCHLIFSPNSRQLVYATKYNNDIYLCNTPPEILASIQPVPQDRTNSSRNIFLTDSGTLSHTVNRSTSEALPNAQESVPAYYSLPPPSISFARRRPGSESWIDRHAEISRIQPTDMRPSTDMQQRPADMQSSPDTMMGQHYELGSQPLHQDTPHFNGGPADPPSTTISPVIVLPPLTQILSSIVGSRLPQLPLDSRELLPSSSHTNTVFSARNDEPRDLPLEARLQNLTAHVSKDEEYPVARGGFGEI